MSVLNEFLKGLVKGCGWNRIKMKSRSAYSRGPPSDIYIYIYIYTHTYRYIYIYIERERYREREIEREIYIHTYKIVLICARMLARKRIASAGKTSTFRTRPAIGKGDPIHHHLLDVISETATMLESRQKPLYTTPSGWWWFGCGLMGSTLMGSLQKYDV